MPLDAVLGKILSTAQQLKAQGSANEANTKHHLIEPLLAGLGWNLDDFNEVDREFKVYDGTFLDYALRLEGKPKLFVEAKALGKKLDEKQFVSQTVNYANNEGVVWCVLTDGIVYHVYKSNEPVSMDRKLLFALDISEAASTGDLHRLAEGLGILSPKSISTGSLDSWGESVFIDMRTRAALSTLGSKPSHQFVSAVEGAIEGPKVDAVRLRESIARVLGNLGGAKADAVVGVPPGPSSSSSIGKAGQATGVKAKGFTIEHHTSGKPAAIVDLFQQLDNYAMSLGEDVQRRPVKFYIGYFAGKKSFFTLELQKSKIYVYLSLPPQEVAPWNSDEMRDVTQIGHYGMGDTEFVLRVAGQIGSVKPFMEKAYLRNRK